MNIRSLTRGDGVVIGAAVVLFIASFLDVYACPRGINCSSYTMNAWDSLSLLMSVYLAGIIGAVLLIVSRSMPDRKVAGFDIAQFGAAFTVFSLWTAFWTTIGGSDAGAGLILGLLATIVLAGGAVAAPMIPALKAPLMGAPSPVQPVQPQFGYGYPSGGPQTYGNQPPAPYNAQQGHPDAQPTTPQAPQPDGGAPAGDFTPFWFAVPVARPLYGEDGAPTPIAELAPGTWYLAVEQRGSALIAQTQDGRRGVLQDTTGIQRG
ncbi:hypothetical protein OG909_07940 [Streptomyces sp. NBC_01754]|uniref:DUF5336 domain-containing protein n=1 Tax=Streptomyces sp. NBC_01754 TaxID=2975930 RepID=UPI002DD88AAC|nr:hypothetical protein [Streptomyces sp. NBC_01754]WSC92231.1 hypothetical protein OG909_07940 [Streptomyces sp. NBC_01754]